MLVKLCFIVLVVWQARGLPSRAKRQGFSWGDDTNANTSMSTDLGARPRPRPTAQTPPPASASGTTTTTPAPRFSACIRNCPTTPQYNPICGSNSVTYPNESHMRCAVQCGLSVQRAFGGTCRPL